MIHAAKRTTQHIRWMIRRDMHMVQEIEIGSFERPWNEEDFILGLRSANVIGMVAEDDDRVTGFMIYGLHKTQIHLIRLAVHPNRRRETIGAQLIEKLYRKLTPARRRTIFMEIPDRNLTAQLFLRVCGFRAESILREHDDAGDDAYLMILRLDVTKHGNREGLE